MGVVLELRDLCPHWKEELPSQIHLVRISNGCPVLDAVRIGIKLLGEFPRRVEGAEI